MNTRYLILLAGLLILSGCIDIVIEEQVDREGNAVIKQTFYLERFVSLLAEMNESVDKEQLFQEMVEPWEKSCALANLDYNYTEMLENISECGVIEEEMAVYFVTKPVPVETFNQSFEKKEELFFTYYILTVPGIEDASSEMEAYLNLTYYITMPGEIKETTAGEVLNKSSVKLTIGDLAEDVVIKSKELNILPILILVVVIGLIVVLVVLKRK
ncbi:MAG: hypothetical protein GXN92_00110 [Candidatus Micrarchaeota archaeon]|nr:hypothetical protein [Candidatus Micrarchaeota archaeon]